ncbi:MAG TPA: thiol:disulfide interchange protein DsbA/DsbL [Gammaproteobacteria bacterium]
MSILFGLLFAASASAASFDAGTHYTVIGEESTAEPVVMEFFSYGCGGCFVFDAWFQRMKAEIGDGVDVEYVPVDFGGGFWTPTQELFLVMDALKLRDALHDDAFRFIHDERNRPTADNMKKFLARHGVTEEKYEKTAESFPVHVKKRRYDQLTRRYGTSSTPTVIVNGRYQVNQAALSGPAQFVELVQYLLKNPAPN